MTTDVIIAGGGVAGATAAAAMASLDYRVLIIEPGLDNTKRLAGELIHPPGVAALRELGLMTALEEAGGTPVHGFTVFPGGSEPTHSLPYGPSSQDGPGNEGFAIEHAAMADALLTAVGRLPQVTVWKGSRVTAVDLESNDSAGVTVDHQGSSQRLRTPLLVAADGRTSLLRRMANIGHTQVQLSNMVGYRISAGALPQPGFGHVFAGAQTPVLAYRISSTDARIMFDVPLKSEAGVTPSLGVLGQPLRMAVEEAAETQVPLRSANYAIVPEAVYRARLVLAGDAGGCCHPLTATGLTACTRDALLLRDALRENKGDISRALARYARLRESPQRTRLAGAELLYDLFRGETLEMCVLRQALYRYWQASMRGRVSTMSLLSTQESRLSFLIREYIKVCRYAVPELISWSGKTGENPNRTRTHAVRGLSRALIRFVK